MDMLLSELLGGLRNWEELVRVVIRLLAAAGLGAVAGLQRERAHKPAGLRTHMLVALGSALFIIVPIEIGLAGSLPQVMQGVATGIGFIGAGAILKLQESRDIQGLTTAAGIWMTAAVGVAVGLGGLGIAIVATVLTWMILSALIRIEQRVIRREAEMSKSTRSVSTSGHDAESSR
jgi:putative Mg2+ transporter-C (MgtC) family protein